jgi:aryl-alcohol dehydrogenase-like predicted oxidoreductase
MTTSTPTYLELSKTYQEQMLSMIEQSQKVAVDSVSAWAKATQPLAKNAPVATAIPGMASPKDLVDNAFGFATKLMDAQHEYLTAVFAAAEPAMPKTPAAAK